MLDPQDLVVSRVQSSHSVDLTKVECHHRTMGLEGLLVVIDSQLLHRE